MLSCGLVINHPAIADTAVFAAAESHTKGDALVTADRDGRSSITLRSIQAFQPVGRCDTNFPAISNSSAFFSSCMATGVTAHRLAVGDCK
jgi:hypothetical protein